MSMLAENRRKSKWVINPTKKPIWSTDSSGIKFGKQLMEKMGWSAGKGLGLNEQGIQEPLKVSFKNDTKGMGFKGNDDDWIEHQDEFNVLLNQLRNSDNSSAVNGSEEKNEIKSLEERSKKSKARVHYQKFTRGKDLSKYSENDLACILGTGKTKKKDKLQTEEVIKSETKVNGDFETSFGVTTINSGSINDYFKKKWMVKPSEVAGKGDEEWENEENFRPSFSMRNSSLSVNDEISVKSEEQKVSIKKHKSMPEKESVHIEEDRTPELDETEDTEKGSKKKRKKQKAVDLELEEPESKKRRKNCNDSGGFENSSKEPEGLSVDNENCCNTTEEVELKKEKKKRKRNLEVVTTEKPEQIYDTSKEVITLEEESSKRKKKKKDKKEKECENKLIENGYNNQSQPTGRGMDESCLEIEFVKTKKKKKEKLEYSGEIDNNTADTDSTNQIKTQELEKMEKSSVICQSENTMDVESGKKKKKKKDKKEKLGECDDTNLEVPSSDNKNSEEAGEGDNNESGKKKNKKSKKEKLDDNNEIENERTQIETTTVNFEEEILKKKKKKDKKEKFKEIESKNKESCMEEERIQEECVLDVESVEKIKKKKHKKEKKEDNEGTENMEEPGGEKIQKETELSINNKKVNGVLNGNTEGQDRLQKLRGNLFPDKAEDKYFPERGTNERVLKLIRWTNLAEFRGSNVRELEGYGRRKIHEKQSR